MALYGPWFEHFLGMKPWDLERLSTLEVTRRLAWVKARLKAGEDGDD